MPYTAKITVKINSSTIANPNNGLISIPIIAPNKDKTRTIINDAVKRVSLTNSGNSNLRKKPFIEIPSCYSINIIKNIYYIILYYTSKNACSSSKLSKHYSILCRRKYQSKIAITIIEPTVIITQSNGL